MAVRLKVVDEKEFSFKLMKGQDKKEAVSEVTRDYLNMLPTDYYYDMDVEECGLLGNCINVGIVVYKDDIFEELEEDEEV